MGSSITITPEHVLITKLVEREKEKYKTTFTDEPI